MADFHESPNMYPNLSALLNEIPLSDQHLRLNKINEIKYYFVAEIKERELMSKRLSKCISSLDYFDNSFIGISVATGSISIASFATVVRVPEGITSARFSRGFSSCTGIVKKTVKNNKK